MKLRDLLPAEQIGNAGEVEILRVSGMKDADAASVVFATDADTLSAALESAAGAILAPRKLEGVADQRVAYVRDPRYSFAEAGDRLRARPTQSEIHPSAVIADGVAMGTGCQIGPGCVIGEDVILGDDVELVARVTLYPRTRLGSRVVVQAGAVLGSTGFGYARNAETGRYLLFPQQGSLVIGDDVEIGANTTIDRGALGETRIGSGTKIDNLVHIGHNCVIGENVIIAAQTGISGSSIVEDGAILGGQVGIGEHATVGAGVILGGGAGVLSGKKMKGPGQVFWGRPARPLKEYLRDLARLRKG
ncbi:UDP-3-O-(3-hydroxymyristoyl)glucosamine N-acyltransferase [Granulicella sibirica]|uniref:UDP-3-O-[3-hydroxymyristoyl] glucosamine N-acyltransferase n=1 Tax=Granulicella sibirica TaxID=2479048 RepID=A0A4V1L5U5_9BACT|nr:UDP-3-O-(3-hydroxymyristoyl)glucosamine N-acyltransferase [Granulicella sibirica]RXH56984.1 UDP-3-O-[3-hydroxymyristoyl] glucosamine N-acyltransferase [Granulicella sibirica]